MLGHVTRVRAELGDPFTFGVYADARNELGQRIWLPREESLNVATAWMVQNSDWLIAFAPRSHGRRDVAGPLEPGKVRADRLLDSPELRVDCRRSRNVLHTEGHGRRLLLVNHGQPLSWERDTCKFTIDQLVRADIEAMQYSLEHHKPQVRGIFIEHVKLFCRRLNETHFCLWGFYEALMRERLRAA